MPSKPAAVIYRDWLLPPSETFILAQAEALQRFTPYYVGLRLKKGLLVPEERTLVVNHGSLIGRVSEAPYKLVGFAPTFFQRVQKLNPMLIHAHFGISGAQALPLRHRLQVPMLVTYHGYEELITDEFARCSYFSHRVYLRRRELLKHETRLFIAVSNYSKENLLQQCFPPDKIIVHYIGVDTDVFQPNPAVLREPIVLFVGRLVEKKGCEYLIQAMSEVQAIKPEVKMVVIGDGELRPSLEKLAKEKLQRYQFLGVQPPEGVRAWMNRAKVFSVPSITAKSGDAEGFGMVFAEAQAMELPVVSFANGGIPEAVAHGEAGFLVAERNWQGLAKHILLLLERDDLWHRFSKFGLHRVRTSFNLQKQTAKLEDVYEQVLRNFQTKGKDSTNTNRKIS
jgi:glycosyltransferase involved in cell wall biosynthesis